MVHADVRREPSQDTGQIVMRTAVQGGLLKGPLAFMGPECHFKLVLNVELSLGRKDGAMPRSGPPRDSAAKGDADGRALKLVLRVIDGPRFPPKED